MSWYTVAWVGWLLLFLGLELPALASRVPGETLSEHVWSWFKVLDDRHTPITWVLRSVLLLFLGWLFLHLGFGWLTPSHPLPWR
jgi:hypothetical protein